VSLAPAPRWHEYADAAQLAAALAQALDPALQEARATGAVMLLSGGTTPEPAYRTLAASVRDWSGISVGLVDDRRVGADDPGSNARLLRETLRAGLPGGPTLLPLVEVAQDPAAELARANAALAAATARTAPALVLFGMGEDGHTASLFPGSPDLPAALASAAAYVALDASGCPGAQRWPQRLTLTPAGWATARRRLLVMRGAPKRAVFERALRDGDALALPVAAAIRTGAAALDVHWCP